MKSFIVENVSRGYDCVSYFTARLVVRQGGGLNCARPPQEAKCNDLNLRRALGQNQKNGCRPNTTL